MKQKPVSIVPRLAHSMDRRDEAPNIELAKDLVKTNNLVGIAELVDLAQTAKKSFRYNAIKALYEIGEIEPGFLLPHKEVFIQLLADKDNRILWGTIQALNRIAPIEPDFVAANLNAILDAADRSSVIAKDCTMSILSQLNADTRYSSLVTPVFLDRLTHAAPNQFPMYAEFVAATLPQKDIPRLVEIIKTRQKSIASPAKQKRLNKLLKSLSGTT